MKIVGEQFDLLKSSNLLRVTSTLTVSIVTSVRPETLQLPFKDGVDNIKIRFFESGYEDLALSFMQNTCAAANSSTAVYYFHSKGSLNEVHANTVLRGGLMQAIVGDWYGCYDAVASDRSDVCGLRYSPFPHAHFPGNFWWSHCAHISRLVPVNTFSTMLSFDDARCGDSTCGRLRFGSEHWVCSHPFTRPYDCLHNHPYIHSYVRLDHMKEFKCLAAPRPHIAPSLMTKGDNRQFLHHYQTGAESCRHTLAEYGAVYSSVSLNDAPADTIAGWMILCADG
jgi:hypothetical protein